MITKNKHFIKGWDSPVAVHPGEFLRDVLEDYSITQLDLSVRAGLCKKLINEIINGENSITITTAFKLSKIFPMSVEYWINLQKIYESDLARIAEKDKISKEISEYLESFRETYAELVKYGLVEKVRWVPSNFEGITLKLQRYFAVDSLGYIDDINLKAAFRKYKRANINHNSLAAWLRLGQIRAHETEVSVFDARKLKDCLNEIKELSINDPKVYISQIKDILAKVGVVLVCAPYFKNTHVQGATQWVGKDKVCIILKTSKQGEDKFWFNLFHEIAHILKHGKKEIFINIDDGANNIDQEEEADAFAQRKLIPGYKKDILEYGDYRNAILGISKKNKISPSIVAGRIAHEFKDVKKVWALTSRFIRKIDYVDQVNSH